MKIKKGDTVQIICGKDLGKSGQVLHVYPKRQAVLVENLNVYKKHRKPKRQGEKGEIINMARPVNISNVLLMCKNCNRGQRVAYKGSGSKKTRICKKCGRDI